MGEVYVARDTRLERDVALKVLQSAQLDKVTFVFNFVDELRRLPASKWDRSCPSGSLPRRAWPGSPGW